MKNKNKKSCIEFCNSFFGRLDVDAVPHAHLVWRFDVESVGVYAYVCVAMLFRLYTDRTALV